MRLKSQVGRFAGSILLLGAVFFSTLALAQSNASLRVMAANLNGDAQSYQPFAIRLFQGLKPDIVAIQEFNYYNNTASDFRSMVDTAFGTNFVYYREPYTDSGDIPNGIISRYTRGMTMPRAVPWRTHPTAGDRNFGPIRAVAGFVSPRCAGGAWRAWRHAR